MLDIQKAKLVQQSFKTECADASNNDEKGRYAIPYALIMCGVLDDAIDEIIELRAIIAQMG